MSRYVWKTTADRILQTHYEQHGPRFVAAILGIDPKQVCQRANKRGLKTKCARGKPFESVDSRRGPGKRFERKQRVEIK